MKGLDGVLALGWTGRSAIVMQEYWNFATALHMPTRHAASLVALPSKCRDKGAVFATQGKERGASLYVVKAWVARRLQGCTLFGVIGGIFLGCSNLHGTS